jgi:hypothetical protein
MQVQLNDCNAARSVAESRTLQLAAEATNASESLETLRLLHQARDTDLQLCQRKANVSITICNHVCNYVSAKPMCDRERARAR